MKYMVHIRT